MNTENGWVKFYREMFKNPVLTKDAEHWLVWSYLMFNATHTETKAMFGKEVITLEPGQLLVSHRDLAKQLKIERSKVDRIFKLFKSEALIEARTNMQQNLITIGLWGTQQNENEARNEAGMRHEYGTVKETENEKEKRSKREKDKEKEKNKNERMEEYLLQQPAVSCQPSEERDFLSKYDKNSCKEISVSEANNSLFNEFWQEYPKKVGKGYAQECFKKIKPTRELVDIMINAIKKQKKSDMWKRDKGQYIPNPSTWLNQKRWEDDLDVDTDETPKLKLKFNGLNGLEF